ncbi:MAG TPA: hypothetical protein VHU77_05855 [Candidatus Limnocylindria bacterium]|nr:hypothetical protein [Candidatus Limnocylindria bacterium]
MRETGFIGYPTGWLLAVFDDPRRAGEVADSLSSAPDGPDVAVLQGPEAAARFDGLGRGGGRAWWRRAFQQLAMDQMPDFLWYEEAVRNGAAVLAVRAPDRSHRAELVRRLKRQGGHFINYFGSWSTESIAPWHGEEPDVPHVMRR